MNFQVYRTDGSDVYGAFVVKMMIVDINDKPIWKYEFATNGLHHTPSTGFDIENIYISKVKLGTYSLEVPLGAKAIISKTDALLDSIPEGAYSLKLIDVSGATRKHVCFSYKKEPLIHLY